MEVADNNSEIQHAAQLSTTGRTSVRPGDLVMRRGPGRGGEGRTGGVGRGRRRGRGRWEGSAGATLRDTRNSEGKREASHNVSTSSATLKWSIVLGGLSFTLASQHGYVCSVMVILMGTSGCRCPGA